MMNTVTFGFHRGDGDFEVLATLNNNGEYMSNEDFKELNLMVLFTLREKCEDPSIVGLEREDVPDMIQLD